MNTTIYTIGHSNHERDAFIALLQQAGITALADVRSQPYSRLHAQFNREPLQEALRAAGIQYVYLGDLLGARSDDPACYENGRVHYARLAQTESFQTGLDRVIAGARQYRIALMCAEKDPLDCHRTILVSRQLTARGVNVTHILADGGVESHDGAVHRLVLQWDMQLDDLFRSPDEVIESAYAQQEEQIAYREAADETEGTAL